MVNAHERVKAENVELKATLEALQKKVGVIESVFGQLDANQAEQIKQQIAEAERLKSEKEQTEQRLITSTIAKQEEIFKPQIMQLEQSNLAQAQTIQSFLEDQALSQVFSTNNGSDFYAFKSLFPQYWKAEFVDIEDRFAPGGIRKQVKRFVKVDGTPVTDESGVELSINQLFQQANKGVYGNPLKASFNEFNAASGDGFYQGATGESGIKNPFTEQHWNVTAQGNLLRQNRALAQQMAAQAGKKIG